VEGATTAAGEPRRDFGRVRLFREAVDRSASHPCRRLRIALLAAPALLALLLGPLTGSAAAAPAKQPNIVLVMTDDQSARSVTPAAMPNLHRLLVNQGTSFDDFIATTPLCCPSRAAMLTGQYGHNNAVLRNDYALLRSKRNVLPVWLQKAGYRTAHVGKWINGYEGFADRVRDPAPGWDRWFTQLAPRRYYNWKAAKNGRIVRFGDADREHATSVTTRLAVRWTRKLAADRKPFFMQLSYFAPHGGQGRGDRRCAGAPEPAPADHDRFTAAIAPRVPSFNEADVSDKPEFIRRLAPIDAAGITDLDRRYRCMLESMRGVDRGISRVFDAVKEAKAMRRTIFVFTSDNGFFWGEHRIPKGKKYPYEENLRLPLSIRVPPAYRDRAPVVRRRHDPVANIDLAPTIAEWAGAGPRFLSGRDCRVFDGRSLTPLLDGRGGWPADRSFLIELDNCLYRGLRSRDSILLEHGNSVPVGGGCRPTEVEHYNLAADPFQLENLHPAPRRSPAAELQRDLELRLDRLKDCAGIAGRDPRPPSGVFCE
jgi:N-acetylglucosamine-6-sulfatase